MKHGLLVLLWFALLSTICNAAPPSKAASGWRTYRSPDYGFSIRYPSTFTFYSGHPDHQETVQSMIPICYDTTVACFEYNAGDNNGTDLQAAGVSVDVLREHKSAQACYQAEPYSTSLKITRINGILFHSGHAGEGAAGSSGGGTIYRAFRHGVCFEVAVYTSVSDVWDVADNGPRFKASTMKRINQTMDIMLHTFRFTGSVKDGPAWNVYNDSGCGGEFEYPASETVQEDVAWSNEASHSDKITCSAHFTHLGLDYTLAVKVSLRDQTRAYVWLQSSGYPSLDKAIVLLKTRNSTEYFADPYYYIYCETNLFILSVSDATHHVISPQNDPVFAHLLNSLEVN